MLIDGARSSEFAVMYIPKCDAGLLIGKVQPKYTRLERIDIGLLQLARILTQTLASKAVWEGFMGVRRR